MNNFKTQINEKTIFEFSKMKANKNSVDVVGTISIYYPTNINMNKVFEQMQKVKAYFGYDIIRIKNYSMFYIENKFIIPVIMSKY